MQTKFENFLQKMVSSNQEMASKKKGYNRAAEVISPKKVIEKSTLQNSITSAGDLAFKLGNNNELNWGVDGITLANTIPKNGIFGEIKITGSGIFSSNSLDNSGERVWRPVVTSDGVNASSLSSGVINTGQVTVVNTNQPRFFWSNEGLIAYGIDNNGETLYNKFIKYNYNGLDFQLDSVSQLSLTWEGLKIGVQNNVVRINSTNGIEVFDDQETPQRRVQIGEIGTDLFGMQLWNAAGAPTLSTDSNGNLWLQNVLSIGDPTDEVDSVGLTSELNNNDSVRIWAGGDRTIAWGEVDAPTFIVTKAGALYSQSLMLNGIDYAQGYIINQNSNKNLIKIWAGTQDEYDSVVFQPNTGYLIIPNWFSNIEIPTILTSSSILIPIIQIDWTSTEIPTILTSSSMFIPIIQIDEIILTDIASTNAIVENPTIEIV